MNRLSLACLTALALGWAVPASANLVANGGFESLGGAGFASWTITGGGISPDMSFPNSGTTDASFGDVAGTVPPSTLSQGVATVAGASYALSFSLLDESGVSADRFVVTLGGFTTSITGDQAPPFGPDPSGYTDFSYIVRDGDLMGPSTLSFYAGVDPLSGTAWNLDDVSLTPDSAPVPAPGVFMAWAFGFGCAMLQRLKGRLTCGTRTISLFVLTARSSSECSSLRLTGWDSRRTRVPVSCMPAKLRLS